MDERDIRVTPLEGGKIDFLGKFFQLEEREARKTLRYELKRWQNSIVSLVEPRIVKGQLDEKDLAICSQQISSFRWENRFDPERTTLGHGDCLPHSGDHFRSSSKGRMMVGAFVMPLNMEMHDTYMYSL